MKILIPLVPLKALRRSRQLVVALALGSTAARGIEIPSDGSDGVFAPVQNVVVDLSQAVTGDWTTPGTGLGVYDPAQWAVVFKFQSVAIPAGVTVTFTHHPSRAPVIWLVQGGVAIHGAVSLSGASGHSGIQLRGNAEPGPGGFRGGRGSDSQTQGAAGMGPGGAGYGTNLDHSGSGGGYAAAGGAALTTWNALAPGSVGASYGNVGVFPLIGGSGGAGCANGALGKGGGAGGGAILIATPGDILLNGAIRANGGAGSAAGGSNRAAGSGSGGGIRLVANAISGSGILEAIGGAAAGAGVQTSGGAGSPGRIRVETQTNSLVDLGNPAYSQAVPAEVPRLFRDPQTPVIRSVSLAGNTIPEDPRGQLSFPASDLILADPGVKTLVIEAANVPVDGLVQARVVRRTGENDTVQATFVSGTLEASVWSAAIEVDGGFSTIQVRATFAAEPAGE
jgi:hypothetical protein